MPGPGNGLPAHLDNSHQPTFVEPQAAICWSANLQPQIKSSFKMGSLIECGSGESSQLAFHSPGFVVAQPSEGQPVSIVAPSKHDDSGRRKYSGDYTLRQKLPAWTPSYRRSTRIMLLNIFKNSKFFNLNLPELRKQFNLTSNPLPSQHLF